MKYLIALLLLLGGEAARGQLLREAVEQPDGSYSQERGQPLPSSEEWACHLNDRCAADGRAALRAAGGLQAATAAEAAGCEGREASAAEPEAPFVEEPVADADGPEAANVPDA